MVRYCFCHQAKWVTVAWQSVTTIILRSISHKVTEYSCNSTTAEIHSLPYIFQDLAKNSQISMQRKHFFLRANKKVDKNPKQVNKAT